MYQKNSLINEFDKYLVNKRLSTNSRKMYRSDFNLFLKWLSKNINTDGDIFNKTFLSSNLSLNDFKNYIDEMANLGTPKKTLKRKAATIKHIVAFLFGMSELTESINKYDYENRLPLRKIGYAMFSLIALLIVSSLYSQKPYSPIIEDHENVNEKPVPYLSVSRNQNNLNSSNLSFNNANGIKVVLGEPEKNVFQDVELYTIALDSNDFNNNYLLKTSGNSSILSGKMEAIIAFEEISRDSLIFLTPTSNTNGQVLYVKEINDGYAVIAIDQPTTKDLTFNWLLDTNRAYHSIL